MPEKRQAPLPPISITITKDDFRDIRAAFKTIQPDKIDALNNAVKQQNMEYLLPEDRDFLRIVAYFAKITAQNTDRILIKKTLLLDDIDMAYLINKVAPPNGTINNITSYTESTPEPYQKQPAEPKADLDSIQGELFPDLPKDNPPTMIVNYDEKSAHSDNTVVPISKVSQRITQILNKELTPILVSNKKAKQRTEIQVTLLSYDLPNEIKTAPISYYDRVVEDAIGNLYEQGFTKITPEMVFRQINGLPDTHKVSQTAARKVDASIKRLARTWIQIDYTQQLQQLTKNKLAKGEIGSVILSARNIYLKFADGTVKSGWTVSSLPQIYHYSKLIKQVATIPTKLLDTTQATRSTDEIIMARYYLIAQIERIKRKPYNTKILFKNLFEAIGDNNALANKVIKSRRIKAIEAILNHFKELKYITDFKITKEKEGRIDGIKIDVPPTTERHK